MSEAKTFDCWAIVEIMGHVTMAGRVTEQAIGGQSFIRIDVPEIGNQQAFTRFYGSGAIYSITPVDEETGRLAVANLRQEPITVYGLPRQLPPGQTRPDRFYYGDGDVPDLDDGDTDDEDDLGPDDTDDDDLRF
jgi:hypothetical protein